MLLKYQVAVVKYIIRKGCCKVHVRKGSKEPLLQERKPFWNSVMTTIHLIMFFVWFLFVSDYTSAVELPQIKYYKENETYFVTCYATGFFTYISWYHMDCDWNDTEFINLSYCGQKKFIPFEVSNYTVFIILS